MMDCPGGGLSRLHHPNRRRLGKETGVPWRSAWASGYPSPPIMHLRPDEVLLVLRLDCSGQFFWDVCADLRAWRIPLWVAQVLSDVM